MANCYLNRTDVGIYVCINEVGYVKDEASLRPGQVVIWSCPYAGTQMTIVSVSLVLFSVQARFAIMVALNALHSGY